MQTFGRILQLFGLIVVPMALFYYWANRGRASEAKLMFGELIILAVGGLELRPGKLAPKKIAPAMYNRRDRRFEVK